MIDDINWDSVDVLYGSGAELPEWLEGLRSLNPEVVALSHTALSRALCGDAWELIDDAYLVTPILWRTALSRSVLSRDEVVLILAGFGQSLNEYRPAGTNRIEGWARNWRALREGRIALGMLLRDSDLAVRRAALQVLGEIGDSADLVVVCSVNAECPELRVECDETIREVLDRLSLAPGRAPDASTPLYVGDWNDLDHPAADNIDLPELLYRLSRDDDSPEIAVDDFIEAVFGSELRLDARTAVVVRELTRLSVAPSVPGRVRICERLADIVANVAEWRHLGDELEDFWGPTWCALREDLVSYGFLARDAHSNIRQAAHRIISTVAEPSEALVDI